MTKEAATRPVSVHLRPVSTRTATTPATSTTTSASLGASHHRSATKATHANTNTSTNAPPPDTEAATLDMPLTPAQVNHVLDKVNLPSLFPSLTGPPNTSSPCGSHSCSSRRDHGTCADVGGDEGVVSLPLRSSPAALDNPPAKAILPTTADSRPPLILATVPKLPSTISIPTTSSHCNTSSTTSTNTTNPIARRTSTFTHPTTTDRKLPAAAAASTTNITTITTPSTKPKPETGSSGRWTQEEHEAFLAGLKVFGREWKKVAQRIPTRTSAQIRSHAQKYFAKLARDEQHQATVWTAMTFTGTTSSSSATGGRAATERSHTIVPEQGSAGGTELSSSVMERVEKILRDPESAQREVEETLRRLRNRYGELQRRRIQQQKKSTRSQASLPISTDISGSAGCSYLESGGSGSSSSIGSISAAPMTSCAMEQGQIIVEQGRMEQRRESAVSETTPPVYRKRALSEHAKSSESQRPKKPKEGDEALASKELIALHVLGGALYRSASRENLQASEVMHSKGSVEPPRNSPESKLSSPSHEKKKSPTD